MSGPFVFILAASHREQLYCAPFACDSHRVRGVFSGVALLSPVESSIPSEVSELTVSLYAQGKAAARDF
jgi:hypothetical protein